MNTPGGIVIHSSDVFSVTETGQKELQGSRTSLSGDLLEVLILVDGHATVADIAGRVRSVAPEAVEDIFLSLREWGMVEDAADAAAGSLDFSDLFSVKAAPTTVAIEGADQEASTGVKSLHKLRLLRAHRP